MASMTSEFVTPEQLRRKRAEAARLIVTERYARGQWPYATRYRDYWTICIGLNSTQGLGETEDDAWIDVALGDVRLKAPVLDDWASYERMVNITEDERDAFVRKAIAAHGTTLSEEASKYSNLGYMGTYSGMTAQYAIRMLARSLRDAYHARVQAYEDGVRAGKAEGTKA